MAVAVCLPDPAQQLHNFNNSPIHIIGVRTLVAKVAQLGPRKIRRKQQGPSQVGAAYYTLAAMLYRIGAIVGASSTGVVWSRFGPRKGYTLGAGLFAVSTTACAVAPDIGALIAARRPRLSRRVGCR